MTFSIVVREHCEDEETTRFGIGVTTNNPGVGIFCPFVSENGAVCAQYGTHGDVGPAVLESRWWSRRTGRARGVARRDRANASPAGSRAL